MKNPTKWSPGQLRLLDGVRLQDNKDMGDIIEGASLDDLEWFLMVTEHQLNETAYWVKDKANLDDIQAWHRRVRTMTAEILHNKRIAARRWLWLRKVSGAIVLLFVGVVIGHYVTEFFK